MKVYSHSIQGKRDANEDQHITLLNINGKEKIFNSINFLGVFDGHGGKTVSKYLKENLPPYFIKKFNKNIYKKPEQFSKYANHVFDILQKKLIDEHPRAVNYCGSTACISIHCIDKENKLSYLWVLNVGDSRAVLSNKNGLAVQLSQDHKPNSPEERTRIEKMGGKITFDGSDWRVKDLSLSRAFGDTECTPYVSHVPHIIRHRLSSKDRFVILACDGLWDVLPNQDAIEFVQDLLTNNYKGNIAKALVEHAFAKGSLDNITAMVYVF